MAFYLYQYVALHSEELFNNSYNSRQKVLAEKNQRGTIYAADGEELAVTRTDEEGNDVRVYPYNNLFAHVVGYSDKGKTGIEQLQNYELIQSDIPVSQQLKNEAEGIKNPGNDVYTTLDVAMQEAADKALGMYTGAAVAIDVKTGKVLAMISKPDFDPNEIAQIWEEVSSDEENSPLLNRASQGLYPPGSTFKIVTALEYIRENPDTWQNYRYECDGTYVNGDNRIQCYHGTVHGSVDLITSFAKSCNTSFANIGMSLDRASFADTIHSLLFDQELPFELPYSKGSISLNENSSDEDVIQTSIGQGKTQVTPLQMAMITAAIANDGVLMRPYVVESVESASGKIISGTQPEEYGRLMSEKEAQILQQFMEEVVESGTASKLQGRSYTAAGKTGSAEYSQNKSDSHAWFTGYAPAEDPQVAVTVIIEEMGSGGDYAVPIARRILDAYFEEK